MKNWKTILVKPTDDLKKIIQKISKSGLRGVIVVNKQRKLIGTITDGDYRNKLMNMDKKKIFAKDIMNKKPLYTFNKESDSERKKKLISKSIFFLPILNKKKQVIGIDYFLKYIDKKRDDKEGIVFIMAGGKGKRLMPLTKNTPKTLLKISGKPILGILLNSLEKQGFKKVYISVNYLHKKIQKFIQNYKSELIIKIFKEKKPLGTAGSLYFLKKEKLKEPIIVINSDILTNFDLKKLIELHKKSKKAVSILSKNVSMQLPYGVIIKNLNNRFKKINEKPNMNFFVMSGINCISPNVLKKIKSNTKIDMNNLIDKIDKKKIQVLNDDFFWIDVGEKIDLDHANHSFKEIYY